MRLALDRAGLKPGDIDILNAHATATQMGDIQETKAIREVFGNQSKARINNTKSIIAITNDGPKGPARIAKSGSFSLALKHNVNIY